MGATRDAESEGLLGVMSGYGLLSKKRKTNQIYRYLDFSHKNKKQGFDCRLVRPCFGHSEE